MQKKIEKILILVPIANAGHSRNLFYHFKFQVAKMKFIYFIDEGEIEMEKKRSSRLSNTRNSLIIAHKIGFS